MQNEYLSSFVCAVNFRTCFLLSVKNILKGFNKHTCSKMHHFYQQALKAFKSHLRSPSSRGLLLSSFNATSLGYNICISSPYMILGVVTLFRITWGFLSFLSKTDLY